MRLFTADDLFREMIDRTKGAFLASVSLPVDHPILPHLFENRPLAISPCCGNFHFNTKAGWLEKTAC